LKSPFIILFCKDKPENEVQNEEDDEGRGVADIQAEEGKQKLEQES